LTTLFDFNIVIDDLSGTPQAASKLAQYKQAYISPITWVEAQIKAPSVLENATREVIDANFKRVELDEATPIESLKLRRSHRLKLPDVLT